jgi:hypothetical protein
MLSVCVPLTKKPTFEPVGRFHETEQGGRAIDGDLDAIFFNDGASAILMADVHSSEVDSKRAQSMWGHKEIKLVTTVTTPL